MILQFGRTGQLATLLREEAAARGLPLTALSRQDCDVTDPDAVARVIASAEATLVLNATAFSQVDKAEAHPQEAFAVNAQAPAAMARACAARGLPFVHVSTDYVFDGRGDRPIREEDPALPLNTYGRSKRAGEEAVLSAGGTALIVRTSWVFSALGSNFIHIMLGLRDRPEIKAVADQVARPTPARALAGFLLDLEPRLTGPDAARYAGIVHYVGDRPVNRYDFARAVFDAAGLRPALTPTASADFPTPAERPKNAVLDTGRLQETFGVEPPDWRAALQDAVADLMSREEAKA